MKNLILLIAIFSVLLIISCNGEDDKGIRISGEVEGLKVGTLYLQRLDDTTVVTLDSLKVDGDSEFDFFAAVEQPQLLYLYLDKKDRSKYDDRLAFFSGDSSMTIKTSLADFSNAKITGSQNQKVYEEFMESKQELDRRQVNLMRRSMLLSNKENISQDSIQALDEDYQRHLKTRIGFVLNFAQRNLDSEVAPYVLLSEGFDANPYWLDSLYRAMPNDIQNSLYGEKLQKFLKANVDSDPD